MLDYLQGHCQLKRLKNTAIFSVMAIGLVLSCARLPEEEIPIVMGRPVWFAGSAQYSFRGADGDFLVHPFFDLVPFSSEEDYSINFVMATPENSPYAYGLNLLSGKAFMKHRYCAQKDVGKSKIKIDRPPFTIGFIPRLLDQLGGPQKIIVFGQGRYYRSLKKSVNPFSHRVRVVGGVVEKFCRHFPCINKNEWESKIVLVAVDPMEKSLKKVETFKDLKKKINWPMAKIFLENGNGRSFQGRVSRPAYEIVGEIPAQKALKFALNKGHLFKFHEQRVMRTNCEKLYDYVWNKTKEVRKYNTARAKGEKVKKVQTERRTKTWNLSFDDGEKEEDITSLNEELVGQGFSHFFKTVKNKFGDRLKICSKFVRPANIHVDAKRHWFFTYLFGHFKMEELGYVYLCDKRAWMQNPYNTFTKKYLIDKRESDRSCTDSSVDAGFKAIPQMMARFQRIGDAYFDYLTYDASVGGSHEKIYNWAYHNGKQLFCLDGSLKTQQFQQKSNFTGERNFLKDKSGLEKRTQKVLFPKGVSWEAFGAPGGLLYFRE